MRVCIVAQATDSLCDDLGMGNLGIESVPTYLAAVPKRLEGSRPRRSFLQSLAVLCVVGTGEVVFCALLCCTVLPRSFVPS